MEEPWCWARLQAGKRMVSLPAAGMIRSHRTGQALGVGVRGPLMVGSTVPGEICYDLQHRHLSEQVVPAYISFT